MNRDDATGPWTWTFSTEEDRFWCARESFTRARAAGMNVASARALSLAVAELVANAVRHAGGGVLGVRRVDTPYPAIEITVVDRGPGLPERAFEDGYSEGRWLGPEAPRRRGQGLGFGLGSAQRLMDAVAARRDPDGTHAIVASRALDDAEPRRPDPSRYVPLPAVVRTPPAGRCGRRPG